MTEETDVRREAVAALAEALHNDPVLCRKRSPNGHPRWMARPLCVSVAERLLAARVAAALTPSPETYARHDFRQGGYLSDPEPTDQCVWRVDGHSPYCGIVRTEHDDVLAARRGGKWRWPFPSTPSPSEPSPDAHEHDPVTRSGIPATNAWCATCGFFPLPLEGSRVLPPSEPSPAEGLPQEIALVLDWIEDERHAAHRANRTDRRDALIEVRVRLNRALGRAQRALTAEPDRPSSQENIMDALPFPTTDARKWAAEFVRLHGGDEGLMLSWFANAIEHGRGPDRPSGDLDTEVERETLQRMARELAIDAGALAARLGHEE